MGTTGADEAEPPSLDMLKNTPSNIRRLANEIEQCVGRQKYLAHTRSPSDGGDFRWYFCRIPLGVNELAASVPRTEIVGKGDYFRFGMRDSLAIEASFLQREEELLSSWWREYAECSEGPRGQRSTISKSSQKHSSESPVSCQLFTTEEEERVGVPVKGGLYEVDLVRRHSFPVYWNGENRRVLRGHWFARKGGLDWLPLREDVSEQLEYAYRAQVWHRRTFQPSGLFAARVDLQGSTSGLHALFTGEDDTWEAWLGVDASGISSVVSLGSNGIKLRRGYAPSQSKKPTQDELRQQKEEDMDDYCSQVPVRHLVFMVHGIGQRLEKSNLVDDVGCLRHVTASLAERHLTSHQLGTQRVLYIPCQWRKGLTLGGEAAVEKITLDGVRGLRTMLSATVHDVLYYMSPIHCQDIIDSVSLQLNKLYLKFLKRNPGYDGKVSIYGHSLGSVLSYDILCHQENLYSPFPMEWMYKQQKENVPHCSTRNNELSNCNPTLGVSHTDNPNLVEEHAEGVCNQLGPPASSDSDESTYVDTGYEHTNDALVSVEDSTETPGISDSREYCESEMNNSNSMKSEIIPCDENPSGKDVADCTSIDTGHEQINDALESVENSTENSNSMKSEIIPCDENPSAKDVADCTSIDTGYEQISDALESVENSTETPSISDKREYNESEMNHANILKSEIIPCDANPSVKDVADNDKDEIIKSLIEEIDLLKSKIKEFEVACTDRASTRPVNGSEPRSVLQHTDSSKCYTPQIRYTKLEFKVDTFFAVGSPLGVFLSLRNVRIGIGRGQDYWEEENINEEMPACRQMFNVFHPFDPVAYRIEPLVCKEYLEKRPVIVPYHRGGKRLYVGYQEFKEGVEARSQAFKDHLSTVRVKVLTICESRSNDDDAEESENTEEEERTYGSIMMETLTGSEEGRIDHVLQDKTFRHPYISAIGAHTNYWRDPDTALFILKHLYRDIPEHPESSVKHDHKNKWFDPRVIDDEQLPLTFASGVSIKHFVYTAKKVMKGDDDTLSS